MDDTGAAEWGIGEVPILAFGRERRLHARAYLLWSSLLRGRRLPALSDLEPDHLASFAEHGVLIELRGPRRQPGLAFLGSALRDEAGVAELCPDPADLPADSLLAQLVRRLPGMLAAAAPIGFEAELGEEIVKLHRGILLPFAGPDGAVAAILGVMSWKTVARVPEADIVAAVGSAYAVRPAGPAPTPWGDGPTAAIDHAPAEPLPLEGRLAAARTWAALAAADRTLGAAPLHAALGSAHEFMLAARAARDAFAALAQQAGLGGRTMGHAATALVFSEADPAARRLYAAVLAHAERLGIAPGRLADLLDRWDGGVLAFADAARARHGGAPAPVRGFTAIDLDSAFFHDHRPLAAERVPRRGAA